MQTTELISRDVFVCRQRKAEGTGLVPAAKPERLWWNMSSCTDDQTRRPVTMKEHDKKRDHSTVTSDTKIRTFQNKDLLSKPQKGPNVPLILSESKPSKPCLIPSCQDAHCPHGAPPSWVHKPNTGDDTHVSGGLWLKDSVTASLACHQGKRPESWLGASHQISLLCLTLL